ncbi:unnamed protein product [Dimorphilus gyrociliatus]|uniref:Uncharacterized protein n=1 Tax=Dimorphilus gyrociliatus TaxID=2664684 RepID=A0A7I8WE02_9ANNE|nr:unnamed protein product [Dimorphilus gyrociliatus]
MRQEVDFLKIFQKSCSTLQDINLGCCIFSSDMSASLGIFLGNQTNLKLLNLFQTDISHQIGKTMFENISPTCCNIEDLNLDSGTLSSDMSILLGRFVGFQKNLRKLNLYETKVNCEIGKNIFENIPQSSSNIEELKSFNFSIEMGNPLGKFIGYQTNLRHLNLNETDISGEIGKSIFGNLPKSCTSIEKLQLDCCKFSLEMSTPLGRFIGNQTNMKHLSHYATNISNEIGNNIFKTIPNSCCNIEELQLDSCTFSIEMAALLGEFIGNQQNLRYLNLSEATIGGKIRKEMFEHISDFCCNIEELELDSCNFIIEMSIPLGIFIRHQRNLRKLSLFSANLSGEIGSNIFKYISQFCLNIEELNLRGCIFSIEMSFQLGYFIGNQTILSHLDISQTDVSGDVGQNIFESICQKCCNIDELNADHCQFSSEMSFPFGKFIGNQVNLRKLNIFSTNLMGDIDKNIFEILSESCCNIEELNASCCCFSMEMSSSFGKFLKTQVNLKKVNLYNANMCDETRRIVFESLPN